MTSLNVKTIGDVSRTRIHLHGSCIGVCTVRRQCEFYIKLLYLLVQYTFKIQLLKPDCLSAILRSSFPCLYSRTQPLFSFQKLKKILTLVLILKNSTKKMNCLPIIRPFGEVLEGREPVTFAKFALTLKSHALE